jgi:hypothetical protein
MYLIKENYNRQYEPAAKQFGKIEGEFKDRKDAELRMLKAFITKVEDFNRRLSYKGLIFNLRIDCNIFGEKHDMAIMCYNQYDHQEVWVAVYDIEWHNVDELEQYNHKLVIEFGENAGIEIKAKFNGDEIEYYYCEGAKCLSDVQYDRVVSAYRAAYGYLDELDRYEPTWRGW